MWPRLKNSPHTYAHEGLESIFLFEFIERQWLQTDFSCLADNNNCKLTIGTVGNGTQSEKNSKREVSDYNRPDEGCDG